MQDAPAVGKDSPPDLAHLVPSGVPNSSEQPVENTTPTNVPHQNNVPKATGQLLTHAILLSNFIPCSYFLSMYCYIIYDRKREVLGSTKPLTIIVQGGCNILLLIVHCVLIYTCILFVAFTELRIS
jgi:hypothetical protein